MLNSINAKWQSSPDFRLSTVLFIAFSLFLAVSLFYQARLVMKYNGASDFSAYYAAYMVERELGGGIYDRESVKQTSIYKSVDAGFRPYLYSPLLAQSLSIFMPENYTLSRLVWLVIEHVSLFLIFIISAFMAVQNLSVKLSQALICSLLVMVGFSAIERGLFYGQASAIMVALVVLALTLFHAGRTHSAAFFAALATVLKLYPIVFLIALIIKRRFKEAVTMIIFIIFIPIVFSLFFGFEDWSEFLQFQSSEPYVERTGAGSTVPSSYYEEPNQSPTALLFLMSDQFDFGWRQRDIWRTVVAIVLLSGIVAFLLRWKRIVKDMNFLDLFGLGLCATMLASPLLWNHVFIILIPFYVIALVRIIFSGNENFLTSILAISSLVLVSFPDFLLNMKFTNDGLMILFKFLKLYGLLLFVIYFYYSSEHSSSRPNE